MERKTMNSSTISLISNVSLNEVGWKKKVYVLLICNFLNETEKMTFEELEAKCKQAIGNYFSKTDFDSATEYATSNRCIIFKDKNYVLSPEKIIELKSESNERIKLEKHAEDFFRETCLSLQIPSFSWDLFKEFFLIDNIKIFVLNGESFDELFKRFLNQLKIDTKPSLNQIQELIDSILNTNDSEVKRFLVGYIHGYFNVESLGMANADIEKFRPQDGMSYNMKALLDTNYLFSIFHLHENPANEFVNTINEMRKRLNGRLSFKYCVHPTTIKEFKHSLEYEINEAKKINLTIPIAKVIVDCNTISGFLKKFAMAYLDSDGKLTLNDYVDPFVYSLNAVLKNFDIFIYNSLDESLKKSEEYLDDLSAQNQHNEASPEARRRSFSSIEHDVFLWHMVNKSRPSVCDSFLDAGLWIATLDYRLISFDKRKAKAVPICLDPNKIMEMLQIWLPRDEILDDSLLSIIRMPLISANYIQDAEIVTKKILAIISRFSSASGMTEQTINQFLLDKELRNKIASATSEEEELKSIKDNLVDYLENASREKERIEKEKNELAKKIEDEKQRSEAKDNELKNLTIKEKQQTVEITKIKYDLENLKVSENKSAEEKRQLMDANRNLEEKLASTNFENTFFKKWTEEWAKINHYSYLFPLSFLLAVFCLYLTRGMIYKVFQRTNFSGYDILDWASLILTVLSILIIIIGRLKFEVFKTSIQLTLHRAAFKKKKEKDFRVKFEKEWPNTRCS